MNEFLITVFEPILQLLPIFTFFSIIVLCPIKQSEPISTFSPIHIIFYSISFFNFFIPISYFISIFLTFNAAPKIEAV